MSTYCKDRYFLHTGGGYNIKYYPGPGCPDFNEWTQEWKMPMQAADGIRERIWYDVGEPINWVQHWKYDCQAFNGECTSWDPWLCCQGDIIALGQNKGIWTPSEIEGGWLLHAITRLYPSADLLDGWARGFYTYVNNGCVDKQLDLGVSLSESPGWLDYKDSLLSKTTSLIKKLAGSQLFYAFGLAPMATDILGIYKAYCEVPKVLKWLEETNGKPQKIKIVRKIPCTVPVGVIQPNLTNVRWGVTHKNFVGKYRAGATVTYDVDKTTLAFTNYKWEITKRALGLNNPLTFIWEKIPFSFMIDWLIGIGDFFEEVGSYDIFRPSIADAYYSIKLEGEVEYGVKWETRLDHGYKKNGLVRYEYYNRQALSPPTLSGPEFNTPGIAQLINAVALGITCKTDRNKGGYIPI